MIVNFYFVYLVKVAPLAGAWIEMGNRGQGRAT